MATKAKPTKKRTADILDRTVAKNDWEKLVDQVRENPVMYGAGAAFVLLAVLAGVIFRVSGTAKARSQMTQLTRAVTTEDPALRVTEMEPLAEGKGEMSAEALYLLGEAAFEAKDYGQAREAFERLRQEFPESDFIANAVEGLGHVSENAERYEEALTAYKEIIEKWPQSFARRRQDLNIARCYERLDNLAEAVAAYQAHVDQFPGSSFEGEAKAALDRLRRTHPELFEQGEQPPEPDEETQAPGETQGASVDDEANLEQRGDPATGAVGEPPTEPADEAQSPGSDAATAQENDSGRPQ